MEIGIWVYTYLRECYIRNHVYDNYNYERHFLYNWASQQALLK